MTRRADPGRRVSEPELAARPLHSSGLSTHPETRDLDALDAAIFAELQQDGRRSYRTIAGNLGVPEGTVRYRVNRLLRDETIHIAALVHPERLGGTLATLLVRVALAHRDAAARELASWREVMYVSACTGRADLMLQVVTPGLDHLHELASRRLAAVEGVLDVETLVEVEVVKAHYSFSGLGTAEFGGGQQQ